MRLRMPSDLPVTGDSTLVRFVFGRHIDCSSTSSNTIVKVARRTVPRVVRRPRVLLKACYQITASANQHSLEQQRKFKLLWCQEFQTSLYQK
mmetsp:Transcript_30428/g.47661  ORF Transcript_30428/g.47661 Transcript_30428/m.47661 type:complete len:92 (+) Transcript_30428:144-419(+)